MLAAAGPGKDSWLAINISSSFTITSLSCRLSLTQWILIWNLGTPWYHMSNYDIICCTMISGGREYDIIVQDPLYHIYDIICLWYQITCRMISYWYIWYHVTTSYAGNMISYTEDLPMISYASYHMKIHTISCVMKYDIMCHGIWYHPLQLWYHKDHVIYDIVLLLTDITCWYMISYVTSIMSDVQKRSALISTAYFVTTPC